MTTSKDKVVQFMESPLVAWVSVGVGELRRLRDGGRGGGCSRRRRRAICEYSKGINFNTHSNLIILR